MLEPEIPELTPEVRDHAARHLVLVVEQVVLGHFAEGLGLARGHVAEVIGDRSKRGDVEVDVVSHPLRVARQPLRRWM